MVRLLFRLTFIFGLLIHESGHVIVAELNGDEIRHTSGTQWGVEL